MEWEFTPQQVVKGEVDYGLDEFRHDLMQEVAMNMPGLGDEQLNPVFALAYDLCYWLATGKDYDEFEDAFDNLNAVMFLRAVRAHGQANVEMLGAVLQRMLMDEVEAGMPLDKAVAHVATKHQEAEKMGIQGGSPA